VVDNSAGGDPAFAAEVAERLRTRGHEVEVREPTGLTMFDTAIHLVSTGIVLRVTERPDRALLAGIAEDVRAALLHRPSERRRTRSVPVQLGDTARVLEWIDIFD
jgi:hypothetical protein